MLQTFQFRKIMISEKEQTDIIQVKPATVRLKDMQSNSIILSFFDASNKMIFISFVTKKLTTLQQHIDNNSK